MVQLGLVPLGMRGLRRRPGQHLAVSLPLLQGTTNVAVLRCASSDRLTYRNETIDLPRCQLAHSSVTLCHKSGGGAFLIPYFIMLLFCGLPLLFMEIAVGQYTRQGPIGALKKICPILTGNGNAFSSNFHFRNL